MIPVPNQAAPDGFDLIFEISKTRTFLVARHPFFGHLAMQLRPRAPRDGENVSTAGVAQDGTFVVNEAFYAGLTPKQRAGLVAHEVLHPGLFFFDRKGNRDHMGFNVCHDLAINPIVEEMSGGELELPPGGLLDPKFSKMAAEENYEYALRGDPGTPGITKINTKGGGQIILDMNGDADGHNVPDGYGDCRNDLADTKEGQKAAKGEVSAQRRLEGEWKMHLAGAAQQHAMRGQGKLPAGLQRLIEEILHPKLDWTELTRRFIGEYGKPDDYGFARPHRWSQMVGIYLPSICQGGHADVTLVIDSSGSMSAKRIERVVTEVHGICEEYECELRVLVCDAEIHTDMTIAEVMELLPNIKGGGGSDFRPVFERLEEEQYNGAVIAFTDGMISVPEVQPPLLRGTLWITEGTEDAPTDAWGEHINIEDGPMD